MRLIDLHIHTAASDGTDDPAEAAEKAAALGLAAISLTDHDTVDGVAPAMAAGERLGLEVVPGIEVSSDYRDNNVHVLGYFIDPASPALRPVLEWVRIEGQVRNEKLCAMLAADGFDIDIDRLQAAYPGAVIGRPHIAEYLVRKGYVQSVAEGFDKYLEVGRRYFLPKRRIPFARAIEIIAAAGGVPVLAHPLQYKYPLNEVEEMIDLAVSLGVKALECYYSEHTPEQQAWLLAQAERRGLGVSGGSDYHGSRKNWIAMGSGMGDMKIPLKVLTELKTLKS
jgi:hypothetical protein